MSNAEIELFGDDNGIAIIGEAKAVEQYLKSAGLESRELRLGKLTGVLRSVGGVINISAEIVEKSGRWVQLTHDSAAKLNAAKKGINGLKLMKGSVEGVNRAVMTNKKGVSNLLEIVNPRKLSEFASNPAVVSGIGAMMTQAALEQAMKEIAEYLAEINEKIDDILRAQKDAVLADMIAVGWLIEDAMKTRDTVGRVSEVTWSKIQNSEMVIARTQAYALRQLEALAEKLEEKANIGTLNKVALKAKGSVQEWLSVMARTIQLQDGVTILELDRVFEVAPLEVETHRAALSNAREQRVHKLTAVSSELLTRVHAASLKANKTILMNPFDSKSLVTAGNSITETILYFHSTLGFGKEEQTLIEAKRWLQAAEEFKDTTLEIAGDLAQDARKIGKGAVDGAVTVLGNLSHGVSGLFNKKEKNSEEN